jgi:LmbE family N-acetylglucosaminyl deacetylase
VRAAELEESCRILGVTHLERLGYHDSGMMGWEQNEAPDNFWNTPVDVAASRLGDLMEAYRPQVVVTYDANGFYGHPDHIQAHRITMAAAEATGIPDKVYFTAIPKSALPEFEAMMAEAGVDMPEETTATEGEREGPEFGTDDELIAAVVDCAPFVDAKYDALAAHASQTEDIFFLRLGRELFDRFFGQEAFVRAVDRTGAPVPEADLFAGLR